MADRSALDPDNFPIGRQQRSLKGHDTKSLGPSDSSDSGSDMAGPGLVDDDVVRVDRGTNQDTEAGRDADRIVGADEEIEREARNEADLVKTPGPARR